MATVTLPINADRYHYQFRVDLDATFYRFTIHYNGHDDSWYFDIRDDGDVLLVGGQRLKLITDALAAFKHLAVPQGSLDVIDTQDEDVEPDGDNLGTRVLVQYVEAG